MMPFRAILPYLLQHAGYFDHASIEPTLDILRAVRLHPNEVADQKDDTSRDTFGLTFMDSMLHGLLIWGRIRHDLVNKLRGNYAFKIFF